MLNLLHRIGLACLAVSVCSTAAAVPPMEKLLPNSTKGYLGVPHWQTLEAKWAKTQPGQLMDDPIMRPFTDDFRRQLKERLALHQTLGLEFEDLQLLARGEVAFAYVHLKKDEMPGKVVLVDVTNNDANVKKVLAKSGASLQKQGGKRTAVKIGATAIVTWKLEGKDIKPYESTKVYFIRNDVLVAANNEKVARDVLKRFADLDAKDSLANLTIFRKVIDRCQKDAAEGVPEARWFLDPFGFADARRVEDPDLEKRNDIDMLKALKETGFTSVRSAGGYVHLALGKQDILHRTKVYAPGPFEKSMKMAKLINEGFQVAPNWLTSEVAHCSVINLDVPNAFANFGPLYDETAGEGQKGIWDEVLESLHTDPDGPKLDVKNELVAHLDNRAVFITDYKMPITTKSERTVLAIPCKDALQVAKAIEKAMKGDPNVVKRQVGPVTIFEVQEDQKRGDDVPELKVDDAPDSKKKKTPRRRRRRTNGNVEQKSLPRSAVCVAENHLFIASHVDFLTKVLSQASGIDKLNVNTEYRVVAKELDKLRTKAGIEVTSGRLFSHTAEEFRPTYELLRQGKLGEGETLFAKAVNRIMGVKKNAHRKQELDGSKLPPFEQVRRYFGPAGLYVHTEDDGWFLFGAILQ